MSIENKEGVIVYLKPTNFCNVGCSHCYISELNREHFQFISEEQVKEVISKLETYYAKNKNEITLFWHGGEPLSLPYEQLFSFAKLFSKSPLNFKQLIQTSLVPLFKLNDKELNKYVSFFKLFLNSWVTSSYDFYGIRKFNGSEEEYKENLLRVLRFFIKRGVHSNINVTVTKQMTTDEGIEKLFDFLLECDDFLYSIQLERFQEYGVEQPSEDLQISNYEYSQYLIKLYDKYNQLNKKHNLTTILSPVSNIENYLKYLKPFDKWSGTCMHTNLTINPDGSINNCLDKANIESFGNIFKEDIITIIGNKNRIKWQEKQDFKHINSDCLTCEFNKFCNTGCPLVLNETKTATKECSGYYRFLKHVQSKFQK